MSHLTMREPHTRSASAAMHALRFALVLGVHLALLLWLASARPQEAADVVAVRMDVRTIEAPPAPLITPEPQPLPVAPPTVKPATLPQRVVPPAPPPKPLPVLTAAAADGPVAMTASPPAELAPEPPAATLPSAAPAPGPVMAAPVAAPAPAPVVTQARFDADYLNNPAPVYPLTSRMMKEQGTVLLLVNVSALGDAERVQVHQSSGRSRLDEAALEAVRRWRFVPARRGTQAVAASVIVPIVFELDR